jgi:hypothetical protein
MNFNIFNWCCHCEINHILEMEFSIVYGKRIFTVISFNNISGRFADRKIRSNLNLFLYKNPNDEQKPSISFTYFPLNGIEPLIT